MKEYSLTSSYAICDSGMIRDQHLNEGAPERNWETLGPLIAFDRLNAACDNLVSALFAYNRRWRFWREREMSYLLRLPWLPDDFERRALIALNAPSLDRDGFMMRVIVLREIFNELLARLQADGFYGDDPIGEAFVRSHKDEPGRAWNMAEWNERRAGRRGPR